MNKKNSAFLPLFFCFTIVLLLPFAAFADAEQYGTKSPECPYTQIVKANTVANLYLTDAFGCLVQIYPLKPQPQHRQYLTDLRGRLSIVTVTPGPWETATGSRTYFLFPRRILPKIKLIDEDRLSIQLASGDELQMSLVTTSLLSFDGAKLTVDPNINLQNNGGVEIENYKGLLLDTGWGLGKGAYTNPKGYSAFKDSQGALCQVGNDEIFFYDTYYGEPELRFVNDADLKKYLSTRCSQLKW